MISVLHVTVNVPIVHAGLHVSEKVRGRQVTMKKGVNFFNLMSDISQLFRRATVQHNPLHDPDNGPVVTTFRVIARLFNTNNSTWSMPRVRAINGAANWLTSQTRPDLAVQTSFSQQAFPQPCVRDLLFVNQLVHRARQHADVTITVKDIPMDRLAVVFHSDAGFANAAANETQAGYILAFVDRSLNQDRESPWSPFAWRSYKMSRVVASTLAGEAQAFSTASGTAE